MYRKKKDCPLRYRPAVIGIFLLLAGCSGLEPSPPAEIEIPSPPRQLEHVQFAVQLGAFSNVDNAVRLTEALQQTGLNAYHFSDASGFYKVRFGNYSTREQAIEAADTFIRENPTNPRVDYALYIQALAHFERGQSTLMRFFKKDINSRPPRDGQRAFSLLSRLVERYPASEYAEDAEQRMIYLKNRLASYENIVARFYLERDAYVAALNRAKEALETYHGADSGAESLQIMIEAYEGLGMTELAEDARRVLEKNFADEPVALN